MVHQVYYYQLFNSSYITSLIFFHLKQYMNFTETGKEMPQVQK